MIASSFRSPCSGEIACRLLPVSRQSGKGDFSKGSRFPSPIPRQNGIYLQWGAVCVDRDPSMKSE